MSTQIRPTSPWPPSAVRIAHDADASYGLAPGQPHGRGSGGDAAGLHRYIDVLRNRWRLIVATLATVVGAVAVGTYFQTPVYRASGLIELRGQNGEGVPVEALFQAVRLSPQFLETQYGVLRSPALARRVIARVGPAAVDKPSGADTSGVRAQSGVARADADAAAVGLAESFENRLTVDPTAGSNLIRVHYEAADPAVAARVVNTVFETYATMREEAARAAETRLAAEVDSTRRRLTVAERELQAYARRNGLPFAETGRGGREDLPQERLRLLQQQFTDAEGDRFTKQSLDKLAQARGDDVLDSDVLRTLTVRAAELRGEYAKLRSTFKPDYPRTKEVKGQLDEMEALLAQERRRIRGEITGRYAAAVQRQKLLQEAIDGQRALVDRQSEKTTQYRILARDVDAQQALYTKLQEKLRAAEVSAAVAATDVNVIEPAVTPTDPIRPVASRNIELAVVAGLVLGVGLSFLREYTDGTIRSVDELDAFPVPLLGVIPSLERGVKDRDDPRLRQIVEEAFGSLRTAVVFDQSYQRYATRSLLITSAQPGEGKTTVSANLALSLARLGLRVLLIDADTRRPMVHRAFGVAREGGLGDYLQGSTSLAELKPSNVSSGLYVLPAGAPLTGHTELLSSERMRTLIAEARSTYDFVVVDSPALHINAADTRILAPLVDGVLMVVRSGITPRALVGRLMRDVPNLAGMVLNGFDFRRFPAYYHDYGEDGQDRRLLTPGPRHAAGHAPRE